MSALVTSCTGGGCVAFHRRVNQKKSSSSSRVKSNDRSRVATTTTRTAVRMGAAKDDLLLELVQALGTMGQKKIEKDFNELVVEPFSVRARAQSIDSSNTLLSCLFFFGKCKQSPHQNEYDE